MDATFTRRAFLAGLSIALLLPAPPLVAAGGRQPLLPPQLVAESPHLSYAQALPAMVTAVYRIYAPGPDPAKVEFVICSLCVDLKRIASPEIEAMMFVSRPYPNRVFVDSVDADSYPFQVAAGHEWFHLRPERPGKRTLGLAEIIERWMSPGAYYRQGNPEEIAARRVEAKIAATLAKLNGIRLDGNLPTLFEYDNTVPSASSP